jgi:MFS family permease
MAAKNNIRLLCIHNFFVNFEPYYPIAIVYFTVVTGSYALSMTVMSLIMLSSALFEIPTGILSDYIGRRKTLFLGSIAGTFSMLFYGLGGSFWILVLGSICEGLAMSFYSGNNDALLHETLREQGRTEEYGHVLGQTSAFFQAGLGVSALLGSAVAFFYPLRVVVLIGIVPRILCILISFFIAEPRVHEKHSDTNIFAHMKTSLREFRQNRKLRTLSIASILNFGIAESSYNFTPAFFALLWPVWALGLARLISNITGFIGFWFAGAVMRRWKELKSLIAARASGITMWLFALLVPSVLSPIIASSASVFYGLSKTAERSLLQREFTPHQRATMGSFNQLGGSLFFGIFGISFGLIADKIGPTHSLIITELFLATILLIYWRLLRRENPHSNS